jgi:hypothetical protein
MLNGRGSAAVSPGHDHLNERVIWPIDSRGTRLRDTPVPGPTDKPIINARGPLAVAAAVILLAVSPAAAQAVSESLNFLDTPVDITPAPGSVGTWAPTDLTAYVPSGASGAIIQWLGATSDADLGVRKNGSGDTWMLDANVAVKDQAGFLMTGLDAGRVCEIYVGDAGVTTWLVGYTMEGVTFFTTAKDKSLGTPDTWADIDISADTAPDTAIGAIFTIHNTGTGGHFSLHKKGSTDDYYRTLKTRKGTTAMIGVDSNQVARLKVATVDNQARLIGYVTSGAVFFTNALDKSTGTKDIYEDVDISGDVGTDEPNGVILEWISVTDSSLPFGVRPQPGYDIFGLSKHDWAYVGVDANYIFEQKIDDADKDLFLIGYSIADPTNYRSIGTDTGTLASGTASIAQDSKAVTFGASLPSNVGVGDELVVGGETFHIKTRDSATQVTVHDPAVSDHTDAAYTITRAYNAIQSWEDARDGALVAENRREVGVCYNDSTFTPSSTITISGSTVDSTHYMKLTVAEGQRHSGVAGAGVLIQGTGHSGRTFVVQNEYTVLEWLAITNFASDAIKLDTGLADGSVVANLLIYNFKSATRAINMQSDATVRNTIIYDGRAAMRVQDGATGIIENCTIYDMENSGIDGSSTAVGITVRNTIAVGNTPVDMELGCAIDYFDYNMYSTYAEFTPSGGNDQSPPADLDNLFVTITAGSEDLHLEPSGHAALDTGFDLSADFSIDIDGETRSAPWDIGADEGGIAANFRSVGTNSSVIYQTGDASISAGGTVVTFGGGADLPTNIGLGDVLVIGAETLYISSRDSTTQVTVQAAASGTHSSAAYTISRAYNTFQAWEDDRDGDLVGENRREVAVTYDDSPFAAGATIDDSTTDSDHYMMITVAEGQRHTGVAGSGARVDAAGGASDIFILKDPYSRIEWMEILGHTGDSGADGVLANATGGENATLQYLLIHDYDPAAALRIRQSGAVIRNCILYNGRLAIVVEDSGTATVENVTSYNMSGRAIQSKVAANTMSVTNTISLGSAVNDFELDGPVSYFDYNMYATASGFTTGANDQAPPADLDDLFYSIAVSSENLHLEDSGHNAVDTGLDLSSTFTSDIDAETRSVPWDIGADEVAALPLRISSGANQTFTVGDSTTAISPITVTDHGQTPVITAVDDIRIRIPAGFNMDWDIFDTIATITGSAAAKVSTTVSYEDSDKTLVIDVTSDFAASDAITISGLSFTSFSAASSSDYLDLDVNNDATADATDDKTIQIDPAPSLPDTGTPLLSWREVEPGAVPAPASSVAITFDDMTPDISSDDRNSASFAHTIGSCSCCDNAIIVVVCVTRGDQGVTDVSYGGQPLAPAVSEPASTSSGNEWVTIWYRTNPLPGTNMVDVTFDIVEAPTCVVALSYFGVDQSSPIGATAGNSDTSSSNPVTVSISTTVDGSVVVGGLGQHGGDTDPHDQGADITTEHYDLASGGATSSDSGYAAGEIATTTTGIYTFEWTGNVSDDWAIACIELKPAQ